MPTTVPQRKKSYEAADLLIQHLGDTAFDAVINPENQSKPSFIWQAILERYASQYTNNRGRIWLNFIQYNFDGNLSSYIRGCRKLMNELAVVKLKVPQDILSYTILAKLTANFYHLVNSILLNNDLLQNPTNVLNKLREVTHLESARALPNPSTPSTISPDQSSSTALLKTKVQKGPKHPCSKGHHNPLAKHPESRCWQLHPHL